MKRIVRFMLAPILVLAMFTTVFANSPSIVVNNETLPVSAVSKGGRVLVPLRVIFESLNATVDYNAATKTITGNQNGKIIILKVNDKVASVDGALVTLDVPASIIKGSTLVPVRFIGESLGAKVDWHNNTVLINSDRDINKPASSTTTNSQANLEIRKGYNRDFEKLSSMYRITKIYVDELSGNLHSYIGHKGLDMAAEILDTYEIMYDTSMETAEGLLAKYSLQGTILDLAEIFMSVSVYEIPDKRFIEQAEINMDNAGNYMQEFMDTLDMYN